MLGGAGPPPGEVPATVLGLKCRASEDWGQDQAGAESIQGSNPWSIWRQATLGQQAVDLGWAGTYSSPKEKPDAPHYPGLPTLGVGCLGPSAVLTSRPHSLIVWAPQSYVDCFWVGESFVPKDGVVLPSKDATTPLCLHPLILDRHLTKPTWDDSLLCLSLKTDLWAPLGWLLTFRKYVLTLKPTLQQPLSSREDTALHKEQLLLDGRTFL